MQAMTASSPPSGITQEQQEITELVRSGAYFDETKKWYQALYIGPIAERTFFLIIAFFAILVAVAGIIAVLALLPLVERPGILVSNDRMDEVAMNLRPMHRVGEPLDANVRNFYLRQYVVMRESYDKANYPRDYVFVRAHSDEPTFADYASFFAPTNPKSPLVTLGEYGFRIARVQSVEVNTQVEPKIANVRFSTETTRPDGVTTEEWTATIGFYYSAFEVRSVLDPVSGEARAVTEEPDFKVVSYAVTPAIQAAAR
jgi:type IV secretion system protein VirB8